MPEPARGEVWGVDLNPTRGHEQAGIRPALVLSGDVFNQGPADLIVVVPITSRHKSVALHVPVHPPEGGLRQVSYIKCEDIRSVSKLRLKARWGQVAPDTPREVEDRIRILLDL